MKNLICKIVMIMASAATLAPTVAHAQPFTTNYWVTANYIAVLGRQPDPSGWIFWTGQLRSNSVTQTQLTVDLMGGGEYCGFFGQGSSCTNPPDDGQFLALLYQNAFGRAPDQTGWSYWLGQLAGGVTRAQVVSTFISTDEFSGLYGGFCNSFSAGYVNPLAFTTTASAVAGQETTVTVTYANSSGTSDIASGQIQFDGATGCSLEWDNTTNPGTVTIDNSSTGCSLDQANSSISSVPGNPKAVAITLKVTFWENDFVGAHEIYAWGTDNEGFPTPQQDLGAFVVTQGQDFTVSFTPGGTQTIPAYASAYFTIVVTSVNGFSGTVELGIAQTGASCFDIETPISTLTILAGYPTSQLVTIYNNGCGLGAQETLSFSATAGSGGTYISRSAPISTLVGGATADFSITVGNPSSPTLTSSGSVSYPITVASLNGFSGYVNLGLSLPASLTGWVTNNLPSQVYLSGLNSSVTTQMTLSSSANTPGGAFPATVTGTVGSLQRTGGFTLSTLVTTSSYSPTAVLNNAAVTPLTISVSPNSPALSGCTTPDPNVTCGVSTSSPGSGTASIWVRALSAATHGTRVLSFNGGAVQLHLTVFDASPTLSGIRNNLTAGQTTDVTVDCACPDPDDGDYNAAPPVVEMTGPVSADWIYLDSFSTNQMFLEASPPPDAISGVYSATADFCVGFLPFDSASECTVDAGTYYVEDPPAATLTIALNNTPGDTDDVTVLSPVQTIPATVTVSGASGTVTLTVSPPGRVTVDPPSFPLADGGSRQVTVTPVQVSSAVRDVRITASLGPPSQLSATATLTVISVQIPAVRNSDTPAGMPDRIPPTSMTPVQVMVQPDLGNSGFQVVLAKLNNNPTNGDFTIGGGATKAITNTTTVNLAGTTQTVPTTNQDGTPGGGNAGKLNLVAQVRGQSTVMSAGFSVAAIPLNYTDTYSATYTIAAPFSNEGTPFIGIAVTDGWASDSGSLDDLSSVSLEEQVAAAPGPTGVFSNIAISIPAPAYASATAPSGDRHLIPAWFLSGTGAGVPPGFQPATGTITFNQVNLFQDFRTGANNIPIPNSGFAITQQISLDPGAVYHLTTSKVGASVTVGSYSSTAGAVTPSPITITQP